MSEFVDYLHEVFREFGAIQSRRMFGGFGIYHDGLMFGLVADDELFLKADAESSAFFSERNLDAFEYIKNGKPYKMSYYRAPETIFDDDEEATYWANLAFEAALRANAKKQVNAKPKPI
ncbi:MAG: TfoX/Sxy family protein [Acidiferrobacterales bacterium]|nr:TfoX/Sxy family protein [Acidiferrobacterales bacterium]